MFLLKGGGALKTPERAMLMTHIIVRDVMIPFPLPLCYNTVSADLNGDQLRLFPLLTEITVITEASLNISTAQ